MYSDLRKSLNTPESLQNFEDLLCRVKKNYPDKNVSINYFNDMHIFIKLIPKDERATIHTKNLVLPFESLFEHESCLD